VETVRTPWKNRGSCDAIMVRLAVGWRLARATDNHLGLVVSALIRTSLKYSLWQNELNEEDGSG
jgi:hypothetical protein